MTNTTLNTYFVQSKKKLSNNYSLLSCWWVNIKLQASFAYIINYYRHEWVSEIVSMRISTQRERKRRRERNEREEARIWPVGVDLGQSDAPRQPCLTCFASRHSAGALHWGQGVDALADRGLVGHGDRLYGHGGRPGQVSVVHPPRRRGRVDV